MGFSYLSKTKLACDVTSDATSDEFRLWSHEWRHLTCYVRWQLKKVISIEFNGKRRIHDESVSLLSYPVLITLYWTYSTTYYTYLGQSGPHYVLCYHGIESYIVCHTYRVINAIVSSYHGIIKDSFLLTCEKWNI